MDDKISFTSFIKDEIMEYSWTDKELKTLFYSFLRTNGNYKNNKYTFTTTLMRWEKSINTLFKKYYNLEIKPEHTKKLLRYEIVDPQFLEKFATDRGKMIIVNMEELKAYLAGAFLGKGWINSPESRFYHCELRVRNLAHSLDIQEVFDSFGVKTVTIKKNNWFYTYIKKASDISTVIKIFNASKSVMIFEDARIERDFLATYKKMESIENYNFEKTKKSAEKQITSIKKVLETDLKNKLNTDQIRLAEMRIKHPLFSLLELQMEFNAKFKKNVSRSTINVWFKKIINISKTQN